MKKTYSFVTMMFFIGQTMFAQNTMDGIVKNHFTQVTAKSDLTSSDVSEWKITNISSSLNPAIQHVYLQQYYQGLPIQNGTYKLTVKDNATVTWEIDQFVSDIASKVTATKGSMSPEDAIRNIAREHNLSPPQLIRSQEKSNEAFVFEKSGISERSIKAKQVYLFQEDQLKLTWQISLLEANGQHYWHDNVDVTTGEVIYSEDWVISCDFGIPDHKLRKYKKEKESVLFDKTIVTVPSKEESEATFMPNSYNVYPIPVESPNHGNRAIVTDPSDPVASPFGWHDTDGSPGAEFTITRGNNVWAQDDINGNNGTGASPDGGADLLFDFPLDLNQVPNTYLDAATTNLFYMSNILHDISYQYGFDEASGNFQETNYGNEGLGNDFVLADVQDGGGINNANFRTEEEGMNPRMQLFLFNTTGSLIDSDLDNLVIAHEYAHGISTRLVGGPLINGLGDSSEQMGEGWSDWYGLMLTMRESDVGTDARGIGTYVLGESITGDGIRPTPYSTDLSINNVTYADLEGTTLSVPHGIGYAFGSILWDITWELIDEEGFDADLYNGTGGNNIALALVTEGLKNTANNTGFVSGRDGILQADQDLYGGQYECLIWTAFANRGVGEGAIENNNGGTNNRSDQTVSFVNPCDGNGPGDDGCIDGVSSFPYSESFEGSFGDWTQEDTDDDIDWTVDANGTPSNGTGPSSAIDGNSYIYVEASGSPVRRAILNSPCLDLSGLNTPNLNFQFHMRGASIGTLTVEARTDDTGPWESIFTISGAQGNDWNEASIDLSNYAENNNVQLRLNTITTSGFQGDVAIDDLSITNNNSLNTTSSTETSLEKSTLLGTQGEESISTFSIAPNPLKSGGFLQISMNRFNNVDTLYSIMNMIGQTVGKGTINSSKTIDVGNLETGMYLLKVEGETQRFIIE